MDRSHPPARRVARRIVPTLVLALFATALLAASSLLPTPAGRAASGEPFLDPSPVVVVSDRVVCSLLSDPATNAGIVGLDSSNSLNVDGTTYWTFGDTTLNSGWVIPNSIAWSTDADASDCIDLTPKQRNGYAVPLLTQPNAGKLTVWPTGMVATAPDTVHFYYASVVSDPLAGWRVAGTAIASFDTASLTGTPALGGALIWRDGQYLPSHTVAGDTHVYVFLDATRELWTTDTILARVPKQQFASPSAYEYWDAGDSGRPAHWVGGLWDTSTGTWSPALNELPPLWRQFGVHNGVDVAYNEFLGKWLAVYTTRFMTSLNARVADSLTGPWSAQESVLLDCTDYHEALSHVPFMCYTGTQHESYTRDGGRTIYLTYSSGETYQVALHELRLAAPISQWTGGDGRALYLPGDAPGPAGFTRDGLTFYASDIPAPGLTPIHRWEHTTTGAFRYGATAPPPASEYRDAGVDFFAPVDAAAARATNAPHTPVYRWSNGDLVRYSPLDLAKAGYSRHEIAFYAPCPDTDGDALSDCEEALLHTNALASDTDADGLSDAVERDALGCDPAVFNSDDLDGVAAKDEVALGTTSPCVWDTGAWGCAHGEWHHPGCDIDTDGDGCRDAVEAGPTPRLGGRRSATNPWDFYDTNHDGVVSILEDLLPVIRAYGGRNGPNYSPNFDRSPPPRPAVEPDPSKREPWDLGPPDGGISIGTDVLGVARQYGHTCRPLS